MKKQVIFVTLELYADWEYAFLATALQDRIKDKTSDYEVKTLSVDGSPVKSIGGFTTMPDYSIDTCPADFAALVLIGGKSWRGEEAKKISPLVKRAYEEGKPVGAICDATVFLAMNGLLNERRHTSNTLDDLTEAAKDSYTNSGNYVHEQAVTDANLITANGTGYLEFAREMLTALDAYPADYIESYYQYFKQGYIEIMKKMNG